MREDPEQVPEIRLGIEAVKPCRGDQREQIARGLRVVVAADEQPVLTTDGISAPRGGRTLTVDTIPR